MDYSETWDAYPYSQEDSVQAHIKGNRHNLPVNNLEDIALLTLNYLIQ